MWPFRKTARQRRIEARKTSRRPSLRLSLAKVGGIYAPLLAVLLYAGALAMDACPLLPLRYRLGQYLPNDVYARVSFRMPLNDLVEKAQRRAQRRTPAVFRLDESLVEEAAAELKRLPRSASPATRPADANVAATPADGLAGDPNALKAYDRRVDALADALERTFIVPIKSAEQHKPLLRWPDRVRLISDGRQIELARSEVIDTADRAALAGAVDELTAPLPQSLRAAAAERLLAMLARRGVYRYDASATQELMDQAVAAVAANPPDEAYRKYAAGERIARRSVRKDRAGRWHVTRLGAQELEVLQAEHDAYRAREMSQPGRFWGHVLGRAGLVLLVIAPLVLYLASHHRGLVTDRPRALAFVATCLVMLAAARALLDAAHLNPYSVVFPVLAAGAIFTIARGRRFALAATSAVAVLVVLELRGGMDFLLVALAGAAAIIYQLDDIRTRTKLIRVGAAAAAVVAGAAWLTRWSVGVPWKVAL
ncbi:MAG: hypothetical protein J7M21_01695, partial [Planctomycetes bacterium]|nr:hypothetical protein [Planctomycetota bacterium]